jgi:hypothetical protein
MSLFQKYVIEWIEIENRAMAFLERHRWHDRCWTLDSPRDLNDAETVGKMFEFFGLQTRRPEILLGGRRNASLGHSTVIRSGDEREFEQVLSALPDRYLEIFRHEPYTRFSWSGLFRGATRTSERALENAT